ncbi:MAG: GNAT family N-acetyltransferase [Alphaproteobacteria bacterium]|nr:GNAT family N-acetyltransferase [Alphaproteobacteria bacterium]
MPSRLAAAEIDAWRTMQGESVGLQRGFFSPGFAEACEAAGMRARVGVIRGGEGIEAFFPFQYRDALHESIGLADRIGGHLSDASGIVARPGFRIGPATLLRLCGIAAMHVDCLMDNQPAFGLDGYRWESCCVTDIGAGSQAYFDGLRQRNLDFVRDTERSLRRVNRDFGEAKVHISRNPPKDVIDRMVARKREQYRRTGVGDALASGARLLEAIGPAEDCCLHHAALEAGGRILAEHLGLLYRDVLSYWFPVYDPAIRAVSPGRLLLWELIRASEQAGLRLIDFGEGEAQYKQRFSTGSIRVGKAAWSAGNARAFAARALQSAQWRLQKRSASAQSSGQE